MNMQPRDEELLSGSSVLTEGMPNSVPQNQFQAYYPTEKPQPKFSDRFEDIKNHKITKQISDFVKQRNIIYAAIIGGLLISVVLLMLMIPQDGEPIEGNWIKSDGQSMEFEAGGDFSNQIYPGSTWSLDGKILTMTSTVQIIDDNQLITKLIIQTVEVSFSDDENAMWWVWNSVTIDNIPQELDDNSCSLLLKKSLAQNTYEFGINAPNYESDKPVNCQ
tara:strand:- start:982 stop:1638 length:657 start_codon:yes stop_codon:yes gene_type:complete